MLGAAHLKPMSHKRIRQTWPFAPLPIRSREFAPERIAQFAPHLCELGANCVPPHVEPLGTYWLVESVCLRCAHCLQR